MTKSHKAQLKKDIKINEAKIKKIQQAIKLLDFLNSDHLKIILTYEAGLCAKKINQYHQYMADPNFDARFKIE